MTRDNEEHNQHPFIGSCDSRNPKRGQTESPDWAESPGLSRESGRSRAENAITRAIPSRICLRWARARGNIYSRVDLPRTRYGALHSRRRWRLISDLVHLIADMPVRRSRVLHAVRPRARVCVGIHALRLPPPHPCTRTHTHTYARTGRDTHPRAGARASG